MPQLVVLPFLVPYFVYVAAYQIVRVGGLFQVLLNVGQQAVFVYKGMHVAVYIITIITQLLIAGYGGVRIVFGMADAVDWSESSVHLITVRSCFPLQMLGRLFSSKTSCSCAFSAAIRASDTDRLAFQNTFVHLIS
jgi:hypothetical protein